MWQFLIHAYSSQILQVFSLRCIDPNQLMSCLIASYWWLDFYFLFFLGWMQCFADLVFLMAWHHILGKRNSSLGHGLLSCKHVFSNLNYCPLQYLNSCFYFLNAASFFLLSFFFFSPFDCFGMYSLRDPAFR